MKNTYTQQSLVKDKLQSRRGEIPIDLTTIARDTYPLEELLRYHDSDFVTVAYNVLLRRAPDSEGHTIYLEKLRTGLPRELLLLKLRHSSEGREKKVRIPHLVFHTALACLNKVPILGWLIRFAIALIQLPATRARLHSLESAITPRTLASAHQRESVLQALETQQRQLAERIAQLEASLDDAQSSGK